jgi:uncharacterized protein (DUF1697 family)
MPRFIALLRAINAGPGRVVKMASLREVFEALGFSAVTTFIASGNVMFTSRATNVKRLERKIEKQLYEALGYEVPVFIRSEIELLAVARVRPFPRSQTSGGDHNIMFLTDPLDDQTRRRVVALTSATDQFHVRGREIYWLRRKKPNTSNFSTVPLESVLGRRFTIRGATTVRHLAEKCRERR